MHLIARLLNPTSGEEFHRHQLKSWLRIRQLLQLSIRLNQIPAFQPRQEGRAGQGALGVPPSAPRPRGHAVAAGSRVPPDDWMTVKSPPLCPCPNECPLGH